MSAPSHRSSQRSGFTLVELLMVIAIIAAIMSIIMQAINPNRQLAQTRDSQRKSDVLTILMAIHQYSIDHGLLPSTIPYGRDSAKPICKIAAESCNNGVNLRTLSGAYIAALPSDPQEPHTSTGTSYYVFTQDGNRITVFAPRAEKEELIQATR